MLNNKPVLHFVRERHSPLHIHTVGLLHNQLHHNKYLNLIIFSDHSVRLTNCKFILNRKTVLAQKAKIYSQFSWTIFHLKQRKKIKCKLSFVACLHQRLGLIDLAF